MSQNKKLPPPTIEGTLPAFYGTILIVPFSMNRAVSDNEVGGFSIKIKTVQSNTYLGYVEYYRNINNNILNEIVFDISKISEKFNIGQYYKIQLAYIDKNGNVGYYSTVGIAKYTTKPQVFIEHLKEVEINNHIYSYIGKYSQENGDTTEKVYSYRFDFYDSLMNLIATSGEKIHNTNNDEFAYESIDEFQLDKELKINTKYYLQYTVITSNKMQISSPKYTIVRNASIDPEAKIKLNPILNYDNGFIELALIGEIDKVTGIEHAVTGAFKIMRASEKDNYQTWDEILRFNLYGQQPSHIFQKDFTIEQGVCYQYALQQYNDSGLTSNKIVSSIVQADFEDAFLYDGNKQLKIKFNPKISSFKDILMESKIDTIGGKFPFVFRNGNVKYKDFPISGLISYQMDDFHLFEDTKDFEKDINLTGKNIQQERDFKLKVLDWLNNGEIKLFKSPTEGNYIVRLMNISLTPVDTLGRMLHSFSCNAYEMAEYNHKNLVSYGFMRMEDPSQKQLRWETINIPNIISGDNLLNYEAVALRFEGLIPGETIYINDNIARNDVTYENGKSSGFYITIGITGSYTIEIQNEIKITEVRFVNKAITHQGSLTYAYYSKLMNSFDLITSFITKDIPLQQFIGEYNITKEINNIKNEIQIIPFAHFTRRGVYPAYYNSSNKKYYSDENRTLELEIDPFLIYSIYKGNRYILTNEINPIDGTYIIQENKPDYYLDGYRYLNKEKEEIYKYEEINNSIEVNNVNIDLTETLEQDIYNLENISSLTIGNGIIAEISYQIQIKEYLMENELQATKEELRQYFKDLGYYVYETTRILRIYNNRTDKIILLEFQLRQNEKINLKEYYLKKEQELYDLIYVEDSNITEEDIIIAEIGKNLMYKLFLTELEKAIEERKAIQGEPIT